MDKLGDMLTREVDFTNKSMDFKVGYGYGVRDGRNEEWERWEKALNKGGLKMSFEVDTEAMLMEYPQDQEENEYRFIDAAWLDKVAAGLTAGAVKHPGETWKSIPPEEHAARAIRHLNMYRKGDRSEDHLINASMRCMMASVLEDERRKADEKS